MTVVLTRDQIKAHLIANNTLCCEGVGMAAICQLFVVLPLIVKGKKSTIKEGSFFSPHPRFTSGNCTQKDVIWIVK